MFDTEVSAQQSCGEWEIHLRRPSQESRWKITLCERARNRDTALAEGELRAERLADERILSKTFATPEEAVDEVKPILASRSATRS